MSREGNAPAGRAAHPRPVGASRAGSPPPVPGALNRVPGHRKTERRKNNTPALGSGTGGFGSMLCCFLHLFPQRGIGGAGTALPVRPPPPSTTPLGQGHEGEHRFNTDFSRGFSTQLLPRRSPGCAAAPRPLNPA